jgi:hypothetical protein
MNRVDAPGSQRRLFLPVSLRTRHAPPPASSCHSIFSQGKPYCSLERPIRASLFLSQDHHKLTTDSCISLQLQSAQPSATQRNPISCWNGRQISL